MGAAGGSGRSRSGKASAVMPNGGSARGYRRLDVRRSSIPLLLVRCCLPRSSSFSVPSTDDEKQVEGTISLVVLLLFFLHSGGDTMVAVVCIDYYRHRAGGPQTWRRATATTDGDSYWWTDPVIIGSTTGNDNGGQTLAPRPYAKQQSIDFWKSETPICT